MRFKSQDTQHIAVMSWGQMIDTTLIVTLQIVTIITPSYQTLLSGG